MAVGSSTPRRSAAGSREGDAMKHLWQAALVAAALAGAAAAQETATEPAAEPEAPAADAGSVLPPTDLKANTVVATVDGEVITLGHMIVLRDSLPDQYKALPDDVLFDGILEQLIQQAVLASAAADKVQPYDTLKMDNDRRGYLAGVALQEVVKGAVTDEALQAAYDARFKDAPPRTEYRAAHILVDSEEKAKDLKTQIDGGGDFAALATANSTDAGSGANGGDLGWFGQGMMVEPFEKVVMALKPGEISAPFQTQFGWHIVKLSETREATPPTLDELREELAMEVENAAIEAYLTTLTDAAKVEKPGIGMDPAALKDLTILDK
jgi:peptidyl-prolyl cis-trans isomerase C